MSYRIKTIKTDADYCEAMIALEDLISLNPEEGTEDAEKLSVLSILIEDYDSNSFPLDTPSAIEAIKFRMDQDDLKPADLIPYIGSASRVSEILSGNRNLTVEMINALSTGLGIPEKALLKRGIDDNEITRSFSAKAYKQMLQRGYFGAMSVIDNKTEALTGLFANISPNTKALFRKSHFRTDIRANHYPMVAWACKVIEEAEKISLPKKYRAGTVNLNYMRVIAQFSSDEEHGIINALYKLLSDGIKVVIEPPLDGAKLDGIAILENQDSPIIGLTLRYDRLDNFWFCLMHELAHIAKHLNTKVSFIYDDLDISRKDIERIEVEADELASEALVDGEKWEVSPAKVIPSPQAAYALAKELGVHVAIIAGKARYESDNWKYLSKIVNEYKVRGIFEDKKW